MCVNGRKRDDSLTLVALSLILHKVIYPSVWKIACKSGIKYNNRFVN